MATKPPKNPLRAVGASAGKLLAIPREASPEIAAEVRAILGDKTTTEALRAFERGAEHYHLQRVMLPCFWGNREEVGAALRKIEKQALDLLDRIEHLDMATFEAMHKAGIGNIERHRECLRELAAVASRADGGHKHTLGPHKVNLAVNLAREVLQPLGSRPTITRGGAWWKLFKAALAFGGETMTEDPQPHLRKAQKLLL